MALLGSSDLSGPFYIAALAIALPLVPFISWRTLRLSRAGWAYVAAYLVLVIVHLAHVAFRGSDPHNLDNISRLLMGIVNGAFFLAMLHGDRQRLLSFLVLIALTNAIVLIGVSITQGAYFHAFDIANARTGGNTNPIPFSQVLVTSLGTVVIFAAGRLHLGLTRYRALALLIFFTLGMYAFVLTGTRGTMPSIGLMALLAIMNMRLKSNWGRASILLVPVSILFIFAETIGGRNLPCVSCVIANPAIEISTDRFRQLLEVRGEIWRYVIDLARQNWLFGYGLGSFPSVLHLENAPPQSPLYTFNETHNQYLDFLLEAGIVGLLPFVLMLIVPIVAGVRLAAKPAWRDCGLQLVWVVGSYAMFSVTESFFSRAVVSTQFGVFVGILIWTMPAPVVLFGKKFSDPAQCAKP